MAEFSPRSYLRDGRPRPVELSRESTRSSRYTRVEDEGRYAPRSKRSNDRKARSKHDSTTTRQKPTVPRSLEKPAFRLDFIRQPTRAIPLGVEVSSSVLVSLSFACPDIMPRRVNLDVQSLLGVVSLVAETTVGDRVPMETSTIVAEQLVGSLRPIPQDFAERLTHSQPCRLPLGFLSFQDLLIRQSGNYRLRVALLHVPGSGQIPTTITTMDSEPIRVERRITSSHHRRQQRT